MSGERANIPWWSWLSLLGLEAPIAAMVWAFAFSHVFHLVHQVFWTYQFLFVAVWCVGMASRLITVFRHMDGAREDANLYFAKSNCVWLTILLVVAGICGLWIILFQVGYGLISYALLPLAASAFYLVSRWLDGRRRGYDSSIDTLGLFGGGMAFAFGVAIPAYFYGVPNGIYGFFFYTPVWYLTVYVSLLLLYRRKWMSDHAGDASGEDQQGIGLSVGVLALLVFCFISAFQTSRFDETWFFYALGFGCACLYLGDRFLARVVPLERMCGFIWLALVLPAILLILTLCWY